MQPVVAYHVECEFKNQCTFVPRLNAAPFSWTVEASRRNCLRAHAAALVRPIATSSKVPGSGTVVRETVVVKPLSVVPKSMVGLLAPCGKEKKIVPVPASKDRLSRAAVGRLPCRVLNRAWSKPGKPVPGGKLVNEREAGANTLS